jgi:hypothetical protein
MMRFAGAAALALFAAACDQTPVDLPVETELLLGTETVTLHVGGSTAVAAEVVDQSGVALRNALVKWASSNGAVATVDQMGTVAAVAEGEAEIIASYGSLTASIPVTVLREDRDFVQKVEFIGTSGTYNWNLGSIELGIRLFDGRGVMKACDFAHEVSISASSSDESVAWVEAIPDIFGCRLEVDLDAPGTATITLKVNGAEATYDLTVTEDWLGARFLPDNPTTARAGDTISVGVIVYDDQGNPVEGRTVNFSRPFGTLLEPAVKTGADGIARTRWVIPTDLRFHGTASRWIGYDLDLGNGNTGSNSYNVTISAGNPASLSFFRWDTKVARYLPVSGSSLTLETGAAATRLLVAAYDKHGNLVSSTGGVATRTIGGTVTASFAGSANISDYQLTGNSRLLDVSSASEQTEELEVKIVWDGGTPDEIELTKKLTLKFVDPS